MGYIPTPTFGHNWPPSLQNDAACIRQQPAALCQDDQQRIRDCNHRDHLTYLRNRRQPPSLPVRAPVPGYMSHVFAGSGPTYIDQAGRVWPVPKSGTLGTPYPAWPAPPPHTGPTAAGISSKNMRCPGHQPIYRSRSDETLSTVSSHPSRRHRLPGKHYVGTERSGHRPAERGHNRRNRVTNEQCVPTSVPVAVPASSEPVPTEEATCSAAVDEHATEAVEPAPLKSALVDSSSNPDSGYSGASGTAVRHLAPCSETSSLHSASSGELASNLAVGSSVRSDSVPSICNSL